MFPPSPARAILLMLGASALVAFTSILAKALGADTAAGAGLHPFQISAGRFGFALTALLLFLTVRPAQRPAFAGARWPLHLARTTCGWLGITAMFAAVARMPLADATAISFLSPPIAMLLAVLLLGEHLGLRRAVAGLLAATGGALILQPGTEAFQSAGLLALAAAVFMGFETIFIKRLSDSEPPLRILLINNGIGALMSLSAATLVWHAPAVPQWVMLAALGTVMVCGQALFIQSMKRAPASFLMPVFYSVLLFAAVYDFAIFGVMPSRTAFTGGALIAAGALLLASGTARRRAVT